MGSTSPEEKEADDDLHRSIGLAQARSGGREEGALHLTGEVASLGVLLAHELMLE